MAHPWRGGRHSGTYEPKSIIYVQLKGQLSVGVPGTRTSWRGEKSKMTQVREAEKDAQRNLMVREEWSVSQTASTQLSKIMSLLVAQLPPLLKT